MKESKIRAVTFAAETTFAFQPNPIIQCPNCSHRFRTTPTRIFNPDCETLCAKCGFHTKGKIFVEAAK